MKCLPQWLHGFEEPTYILDLMPRSDKERIHSFASRWIGNILRYNASSLGYQHYQLSYLSLSFPENLKKYAFYILEYTNGLNIQETIHIQVPKSAIHLIESLSL